MRIGSELILLSDDIRRHIGCDWSLGPGGTATALNGNRSNHIVVVVVAISLISVLSVLIVFVVFHVYLLRSMLYCIGLIEHPRLVFILRRCLCNSFRGKISGVFAIAIGKIISV